MKFIREDGSSMMFKDLKEGEGCEINGEIFIKIYDIRDNNGMLFNAVQLDEGLHAFIEDDRKVRMVSRMKVEFVDGVK